MAHKTNGRMTDNWWLETLASAVTQDASGVGTLTTSSSGGGGATTIADGADVTQGAIADAAVTAGAAGTLSAKLRTISRDLTNGTARVQGTANDNTTLTGSPVLIAGAYTASKPTYTDGSVATPQVGSRGALSASLFVPDTTTAITVLADNVDASATSSTANKYAIVNRATVFNGTTWDRMKGTTTGISVNPYEFGATPITASSGNVANASAVATLAGAASKTTYITGFMCTGSGSTTGSAVTATVTGTISGTLSYTFVAPSGVFTAGNPINVSFSRPIPASAVNTAIVVTLPALGGGSTNAAATAYGYQL